MFMRRQRYAQLAGQCLRQAAIRIQRKHQHDAAFLFLVVTTHPHEKDERKSKAMQELPDLSELSHSEKDELIRLLWSMLQSQSKQIAALQAQVADLQSRRNKKGSLEI
jgi:hypothetical protein